MIIKEDLNNGFIKIYSDQHFKLLNPSTGMMHDFAEEKKDGIHYNWIETDILITK